MFFFMPEARVAIHPPTVLNSILRAGFKHFTLFALSVTVRVQELSSPVGLMAEGVSNSRQATLQVSPHYATL